MPKKITGTVTSDVQDKTIVITVTSRHTHPIYGKQYTVTRKYTAHDEKNEAHVGDRVEVPGYQFRVMAMDGRRVDRVLVVKQHAREAVEA